MVYLRRRDPAPAVQVHQNENLAPFGSNLDAKPGTADIPVDDLLRRSRQSVDRSLR